MFMGTTYNSIDEKNRMIVPSKLRAGLGSRCILTKGLDKCLYIYTAEDWEKQMEKVAKLPESDPKVRAFIRHFCANASECESRYGAATSGILRTMRTRWKRKILRRLWQNITFRKVAAYGI